MNKFLTASAVALAAIGFAACGGHDQAQSDTALGTDTAVDSGTTAVEVVNVTRVIDGPVGPEVATAPEVSRPEEVPTLVTDPAEATDPVEYDENTDLPGPLGVADWFPALDLVDLEPGSSTPMTDLARLANLSPLTITQVHVGCSGSKALVSVEVGGGVGIESVVAKRLTLTGAVNSVDLSSGTTPGLYEGTIAGWYDSVVITVVDDLGRSVTQNAAFDLAAC